MTNIDLNMDTEGIRKLTSVYKAIDHPVRMKMVQLIHSQETISVMEICCKLGLDKESVSKQLSVLRKAEIVQAEQRSRFRYYSLNYKMLEHLQNGL